MRVFLNKIFEILKPFLTTPVTIKVFVLQTTLCKNFVEAFAA